MLTFQRFWHHRQQFAPLDDLAITIFPTAQCLHGF
ncbi:Uncharacterised protein [Vibrio cholerae]|nr:Uncharacterised protein [Vibrio cholerae]